MRPFLLLLVLLAVASTAGAGDPSPGAELLDVRKIGDAAPHNAFTDLVRFKGSWFCTFREGQAHVSPDGALRVLTSADGLTWNSAALLQDPRGDLRDPKITVTPDGRLMLSSASALHQPAAAKHQTLAWFSADGRHWSDPMPIGEPNVWLWRVVWHRGTAYGAGYGTAERPFVRLYRSADGIRWETWVATLFDRGQPNEAALLFGPGDACLCLLRRDAENGTAQLSVSRAPYREWAWKDLGKRIGGPQLLRLPDGRIVAAGRLYDGRVRTALCWLDPAAGTLTEFLALPSGGDTSYPGLVWHDGVLWVSYYTSHEGKTRVYLARVKLPPGDARRLKDELGR